MFRRVKSYACNLLGQYIGNSFIFSTFLHLHSLSTLRKNFEKEHLTRDNLAIASSSACSYDPERRGAMKKLILGAAFLGSVAIFGSPGLSSGMLTALASKKPTRFSSTLHGSSWGTRIFRIRLGSYNGSGNITLQDAQDVLRQLPPMDHANRFTDDVPSDPSTFIEAINGILPLMRTGKTDHAVSARLQFSSDISSFISKAAELYHTVYSKTNPPQRAIAIDVVPKSLGNIGQVTQELHNAGWKYVAWGALATLAPYAKPYANFGMFGINPASLVLDGPSEVQNFSNYLSLQGHIDEPTDFIRFLNAHPTLQSQESAFNTIFSKAIIPQEFQLLQGTLYNTLQGKAFGHPYPQPAFWKSLMVKFGL
jgi:hypothetical protein